MSDLTEQARTQAAKSDHWGPLLTELVDRIEELETEVEVLKAERADARQEAETNWDRIEELEAALRECVKRLPPDLPKTYPQYNFVRRPAETDDVFRRAAFAEESAEWYYGHARKWEIEGRNLRARILFEKRYQEALDE